MELPVIGQKIYVPTSLYVYRGEDDFIGGVAIINKVVCSEHLPKEHYNYVMVGVEERNGNTTYNYKYLMEKQKELKKIFGKKKAKHMPDTRKEFNSAPNEGWV